MFAFFKLTTELKCKVVYNYNNAKCSNYSSQTTKTYIVIQVLVGKVDQANWEGRSDLPNLIVRNLV